MLKNNLKNGLGLNLLISYEWYLINTINMLSNIYSKKSLIYNWFRIVLNRIVISFDKVSIVVKSIARLFNS